MLPVTTHRFHPIHMGATARIILGEMAVFGTIGSIVVVAVFLWVWHWVFVRRVNKMLAGSQVSVATLPGRTGS